MSAIAIVTDLVQLFPTLPLELGTNLDLHSTYGIFAQVPNVDILTNLQTGWTDFIQTGKAGAAVVGLVLGYMIRGITK
jgi:hypothetical protein